MCTYMYVFIYICKYVNKHLLHKTMESKFSSPLTIFVKNSVPDGWQGAKYVSATGIKFKMLL